MRNCSLLLGGSSKTRQLLLPHQKQQFLTVPVQRIENFIAPNTKEQFLTTWVHCFYRLAWTWLHLLSFPLSHLWFWVTTVHVTQFVSILKMETSFSKMLTPTYKITLHPSVKDHDPYLFQPFYSSPSKMYKNRLISNDKMCVQ